MNTIEPFPPAVGVETTYISTLGATGLKAGDFAHKLGRVTLFTGDSFSGKTSRINAITLALLGYVPTLGKTNPATMRLARAETMNVFITDSEGRRCERILKRSGDKVKSTTPIDEIPATPPVLMDSSEYFALSDAQKIAYAFGMCQMEDSPEFSGEAILALVKNVRLDEHTADTQAIVDEIAGLVDDGDRERHDAGQSIQDWLSALIESMKARAKSAKAACDQMTKLARGLTSISAGEQKQWCDQTAAIEAARKRAAEIMVKRGQIQSQLDTLRGLIAKSESIKKELDALPIETERPAIEARIKSIEGDIAGIEAAPLALSSEFQIDIDAEQKALDELNKVIADYKSDTNRLASEVDRLNRDKYTTKTACDNLESEISREKNSHERAMAAICCTACGAKPESWANEYSKEKRSQIFSAWLTERLATLSDFKKELSAKTSEEESVAIKWKESQLLDAAQESRRETAGKKQRLITAATRAVSTAQNTKQSTLNGKRSSLEREQTALAALATVSEKRAAIQGRKDAVDADLSAFTGNTLEADSRSASIELGEVEYAIEALEKEQELYRRAKQDEERNAQAEQKCAKDTADLVVTQAVVSVLEDVREKMVKAAFEPMLITVNRVTAGIIPTPVEYRDGEIGRFEGRSWISHNTFTGTEKALCYAGLSLALAESAPIKLIMIDDIGIMDPGCIHKVLERMVQLTNEGIVGQFIACLSWKLTPPAGVTLIGL